MKVADFYRDIGIPEFKAIVGKRGSKLFILFLLFFISLIIIGIANSSKEYLVKKMRDPFIQYIDIEKSSYFSNKDKPDLNQENIKKYILDDPNYNDLKISKMYPGISRNIHFTIDSVSRTLQGMLLIEEDDFFDDLKKKNVDNSIVFSNKGFGIIVTKEFFKKFNLEKEEWQNISFVEVKEKNITFKLPIAGVVDKLRRKYDFAFSLNYLNSIRYDENIFKAGYYRTNTYFIPNKSELSQDLKLDGFNKLNNPFQLNHSCYKDGILIEKDRAIGTYDLQKKIKKKFQLQNKIDSISKELRRYKNCKSCNFPLNIDVYDEIEKQAIKIKKEDSTLLKSIENDIKLNTISAKLNKYSGYEDAVEVLNITKDNTDRGLGFIDYKYFTFKLLDIDKIESLSNAVYEVFGVKIEQGKIENKKNLKLFERIIEILYYALMIFTITSIIFFITNTLISHLNANKKSLGTLKAFGLSNSYIVGLYSLISFFIIGVTFIVAYFCSDILGQYILGLYLEYMGINQFTYFPLDWYVLIPLMVFVPLLIILRKVFVYLNNVTPGDLIYERK